MSIKIFECHQSVKLPAWVGWNEETLSRMVRIGNTWYVR